MKRKQTLVLFLLAFAFATSLSCKKDVEEQYDDILKKLMVDGSWVITKFTEDGNNITASFNGYICKFHDNNTLTATYGTGTSSTVLSGTWQSNITAQTISAQFAGTVGDPFAKINGTWNITSSSATVGKFAQTKNGMAYTMELTKY